MLVLESVAVVVVAVLYFQFELLGACFISLVCRNLAPITLNENNQINILLFQRKRKGK